MADRVPSRCDQCGLVDDDPKSHWFPGGETYHHDCLPYDRQRQLVESHPDGQLIIEAAKNGVRGADLVNHITSLAASRKKEA